jgi:hypothetical protein
MIHLDAVSASGMFVFAEGGGGGPCWRDAALIEKLLGAVEAAGLGVK